MNLRAVVPDISNAKIKRWILPLSIVLGTGLLSLGLSIVFERRTPKQMDFVGTCSAVVLPQQTTWSLPPFQSLHLRGFGLSVENVAGAKVKNVGDAGQSASLSVERLELGQNPNRDSEQPSLEAQFKGRFGTNSYLSVPPGALLKGADVNPRFGPTIDLSWPETSNGTFTVQADRLLFPEVNRMVVTNTRLPAWTSAAETFALTPISRGVQMMVAHLDSRRGGAKETAEADIRFPTNQRVAYLYSSIASVNVDQPVNQLNLRGCINPIVKFNQRDAPDQPRDMAYDVVVSGKDIDLRSLSVNAPSPDSTDHPPHWNLGLRITGIAHSVKVGEAELVPTELQELFSGSSARQGVLVAFFALGALGLTVIIRISIERVLDSIIPGAGTIHIEKQINVKASGQGHIINVADFMADITNNVNRNVDSSPASPQAKETIRHLMDQIEALSGRTSSEVVHAMGIDMKCLSEELTKQHPRKAQVFVYLQALRDTLTGLGEIAGPSMTVLEDLEGVLNR